MKSLMNLGFSVLTFATLTLTSCKEESLIRPVDNSAISMSSDAATVASEKVSVSALPASITTYITTKYAGTSITKAEKSATKYEITLSSGIKLEFTLVGAFIQVSGGGTTTSTSVNISTLPASIATYIATKYAGTSITKAEKSATKYEVTLSNGVKLKFSLAGVFIEVSGVGNGSDDPTVALPQAIKDYIAQNHAGATIIKAEKSLTKYEVTLSNGYKLEFTLLGQLIKSKYVGNKG